MPKDHCRSSDSRPIWIAPEMKSLEGQELLVQHRLFASTLLSATAILPVPTHLFDCLSAELSKRLSYRSFVV